MNAVRLNTIIASEVILNKTSRRNTVFQKKKKKKKKKNSYCESSQKMALERIRYSLA
jgi:hypothetical protein